MSTPTPKPFLTGRAAVLFALERSNPVFVDGIQRASPLAQEEEHAELFDAPCACRGYVAEDGGCGCGHPAHPDGACAGRISTLR